jgi:hypothetical protein
MTSVQRPTLSAIEYVRQMPVRSARVQLAKAGAPKSRLVHSTEEIIQVFFIEPHVALADGGAF